MVNRFFIKGSRSVALTVVFGLITAFLGMGGSVQAASLENGILLDASVGYQGYMKQNEWYPVRLTLTNKTADDLKGEVVISILSSSSSTTSDIVIPAELPKGSAIQLTASIPGDVLSRNSNKIRFYRDSFKEGKVIPVIGNDYIEARTTSSYTIGVISRDPDTLNFMPSLNQRGYDITVIPIAEKELPEDPILLDMIDTLVINDVAASGWSESQIKAVKEWVRLGGTLVLSGGAGYSKTAEAFKTIAPLEATGMSDLTSSASIASVGGAAIKLEAPIAVSTGKITEGKTELAENGLPLAVSRKVGFGSVISVAFDPSLEPLSTWAGSAMLWAKLLQNKLSPLQPGGLTVSNNMYWNMQGVIDEFPSIKPPNYMLLLFMFVGYMVIVAPVLYIILAKSDRREWSWWLIPTISVLTGIAIFFFGAEDKRNLSAHTIEIIELTGQGDAVRSGATAVFVPAGGTVTAEFDEKVHLVSYSNHYQNSNLTLDGKTQVISDNDAAAVVWRSVPYWSTRKAWLEKRMMNGETGKLTLAYKQNKQSIELTATNDTSTDLANVSLLINGKAQLIGDLKRGESGQTVITNSFINQSGYYPYGQMMFPITSNRNRDSFNRQRQLVDSYMNRGNGGIMPPDSVLVGFSIDGEQSYNVNGNKIKTDNLKLWVQKLDETFIDGNRAIVPAGHITPLITERGLNRLENRGNGVYSLGEGDLIFEYVMPDGHDVTYDKLDILFNNGTANPNLALTVWNEKRGAWTDMSAAIAAPGEYLINKQILRMKLTVIKATDTVLPAVALEGEVQ